MKLLKSTTLLSLVLIISILSSCSKCIKGSGNVIVDQRSVASFSKIRVKGSHKVYIHKGAVQKLEIKADDNIAPLIETTVVGDVLEISTKPNTCLRKATQADVYITIPLLSKVELDGSGVIRTDDTFTGSSMEVRLDGSGSIHYKFEGDLLKARIGGSGEIVLSGDVDNAEHDIDGSGYINAGALQSLYSDASIDGSGHISVNVSNHLVAKINGSGYIGYTGNPTVNTSVNGSGHVGKQ